MADADACKYSIFWNSPRLPVTNSMIGPMYRDGAIIETSTHGSRTTEMFWAGGIRDGLSTSASELSVQRYLVIHARRRGDKVLTVLPFESLLDYVHVQKSKETAPEAKPQGGGGLWLEDKRRVV